MAEPDPPPVLCHLSGNWARVAIDAYTRFTGEQRAVNEL